ncbi:MULTISPECIES: NUDIX hydrolase [unclassified Streptomyces]|uniref:NUDIX hydrolase n=1 Tax=unclassified Streptomyces TaxID=2593676 RepID=UPI000ACE5108|nr:NUDIX hydrolase [Streptomyces sp. TSRI0107]
MQPPTPQAGSRRIGERRRHRLSPWFDVIEAELHEGAETSTWHFQDHPGAAIAVPVTPAGTILVSSEYRIAVDEVILEVPGGRVDPGETAEQAALREMFEEIGATAERAVFLGRFLNSPGSSNEMTHAYAALGAKVVDPRPGTVETTAEALIGEAATGDRADASTLTAVLLAQAAGLIGPGTRGD